jgi:hypothetical protein
MIVVLMFSLAWASYSLKWESLRPSKNVEDCRHIRDVAVPGTLARCPMWRKKSK